MATLQKLRNMGPLLVIFVGLALFAFIAGDAWRLFQSDSMEATVGTIDGEKLSANDFQELYNQCENAQRMFRMADPRLSEEQKAASFTETELSYIKDEAWGVFTQLAIAEKPAAELGITVTNEEIMDILNRKGVFLLKGSVSYVARELHSSEASIYRYLGKLNSKAQELE